MLIDSTHAEAIAGQVAEQERLDQALEVLDDIDRAIEMIEGRSFDRFYASEAARKAYAKHLEAFELTKDFRTVGVVAGNRSGKSTLACYAMAGWLTGEVDGLDWWPGRTFGRPINAWALAVNQAQVRDNLQRILLGDQGLGTGLIPRDAIIESRPRQGVPGAVDFVKVRHRSGGASTLTFRAYSEGREALQSVRLDAVLLDEEPPQAVFEEILLRTVQTRGEDQGGLILLAFSPLKGLTAVARMLMPNGAPTRDKAAGIASMCMAMTDVPHISPAEIEQIIANLPEWQRDARIRGLPTAGAGSVYAFDEGRLVLESKPPILPHYRCAAGLDVGHRNTSATFWAWDPDLDFYFLLDEYVGINQTPGENIDGILRMVGEYHIAIDPASRQTSQTDGKRVVDEYRRLGLTRLRMAANGVEAGITRVQHLMATGRLRFSPHCTKTLAELRTYSRKEDGKVLKVDDHLMDSMRYALATSGLFQTNPLYRKQPQVHTSASRRRGQPRPMKTIRDIPH